MKKLSKKFKTIFQNLRKKFKKQDKKTLIAGIITTSCLVIAGFLLLFVFAKRLAPFEYVHAETNKLGQSISVALTTKRPVRTRVEYGTTKMYLNAVEGDATYKTEHNIVIPGVLPKKHYLRVIAYTENGKEYKTDFYMVE